MKSKDDIDVIQQGIDTGRTLHSKIVGDIILHGISWFSHKIFRILGTKKQPANLKHNLKYT